MNSLIGLMIKKYNWEIKHTVINGHRLRFDGTAIGLFGNWIKETTLFIFYFCLQIVCNNGV